MTLLLFFLFQFFFICINTICQCSFCYSLFEFSTDLLGLSLGNSPFDSLHNFFNGLIIFIFFLNLHNFNLYLLIFLELWFFFFIYFALVQTLPVFLWVLNDTWLLTLHEEVAPPIPFVGFEVHLYFPILHFVLQHWELVLLCIPQEIIGGVPHMLVGLVPDCTQVSSQRKHCIVLKIYHAPIHALANQVSYIVGLHWLILHIPCTCDVRIGRTLIVLAHDVLLLVHPHSILVNLLGNLGISQSKVSASAIFRRSDILLVLQTVFILRYIWQVWLWVSLEVFVRSSTNVYILIYSGSFEEGVFIERVLLRGSVLSLLGHSVLVDRVH